MFAFGLWDDISYNVSTLSQLTQKDSEPYDYDSAGVGGNRFATILLYMSDLSEEDGGETVFAKAPPAGEDTLRPTKEVVRELRSSSSSLDPLTAGSWEEEMAAQ